MVFDLELLSDPVLLLLSRFSRVWLCATPEMAAHQARLSLGFPRQEHWSGLPFPSPMHESEKWKWSCSVMSDPQQPRGLQPSRLLRPRDFPGKNTGVFPNPIVTQKKSVDTYILSRIWWRNNHFRYVELSSLSPIPQKVSSIVWSSWNICIYKTYIHTHPCVYGGESNGTPLQYSCLGSSMDGGAW